MTEFKDIYAKEAHALLLREMRTGCYAKSDHLPRESELAKVMGISRTQLRDILAVLECEGFITRRHGVGTIINRHVLNVPVRMDVEQEFLEMIYAGGYKPAVAYVHVETAPATKEEAQKLHLPEGTALLRVKKLCTADKMPAIYCEDMIEAALVKEPFSQQDLKASVFQLLQDKCGINCFMDMAQVIAVAADDFIAETLKIAKGSPLLHIQEVDYDIEGKPVLYAKQYFANAYVQHHILRKRL